MRRRIVIALGLPLAVLAAVGTVGAQAPGRAATTHAASPAAAGFSAAVTNPWFPLRPGTTLIYRGTKDGQPALEYFSPSRQTQRVAGVPCRVVLDRLFLNGHLAETTRDYYTQDRNGTVWYVGEDTAELDRQGHLVSTEGTWHAGVDGARPGVFMPATPRVGQRFRQEYYAGHAEDHFQVLDLSTTVSVPYRTFRGAMLTKEWTPLEPDVLDHKYYVRGIGTVKEVAVRGPREELALVAVRGR
jgi:hypothetical protein